MGLTYFFYHILFHDLRLDFLVPEMDIKNISIGAYIINNYTDQNSNNLIMGCATLILDIPVTNNWTWLYRTCSFTFFSYDQI